MTARTPRPTDPSTQSPSGAWSAAPHRRTVLLGSLGAVAGAAAVPLARRWETPGLATTPLYAETVALTDARGRAEVAPGEAARVIPGTRVHEQALGADRLVAAEQRWLAAAADWTHADDPHTGLLRDALLDLRVLTHGLPAPVAGWSPRWRYTWPRDAAHTAMALALAGHPAAGWRTLDFLQRVQRDDGWFEARYDPWTARTPDGRERQLDGTGWALWALAWLHRLDPAGSAARSGRHRDLAARSVGLLLGRLRNGVPPRSPDYWEITAPRLTLGTITPVLAGLAAAGELPDGVVPADLRGELPAAAAAVERAVWARFGRAGYPRQVGAAPDAATCFLAPPYLPAPLRDAEAALAAYETGAARPAGGLAPGGSWRDDGVSWTPEVALVAQAHAWNGRADAARAWLDWLARHRTEAGSLPEKVLHDGSPAAVAPLAWTASSIVSAVHALRTGGPY